MADDPYSKWLGLPNGPRPPKAHELLGLPPKPTDASEIDAAAGRRMDQLDQYALVNDRATRTQVQQLMNEVAKARTKLVAKVPKSKEKSKPKAAAPAPTSEPINSPTNAPPTAPTDAPPQPVQTPFTEPLPVTNRPGQTPALTPETLPDALPFVERSRLSDKTKSAIVFWSLITWAWAASLAAVFAVTYTIAAPEASETTRGTVLAAGDPLNDLATTEQETELSGIIPETPASDPEPVGPTQEELAAQQAEQERLALEQERAEQARLAAERQKAERKAEEERRQQQAEQRRIEQERKQALEKQRQEALRQQALAKQQLREDYFAERDRLQGDAKVALIKRAFIEWNDGHEVEIDPSFEDGRLIGIELSSKINQFKNQLTDLTPLRGLELRSLRIEARKLKTLAPLKGMPLERLELARCESLEDITALKGMPLESFSIAEASIKDLEPLRGAPLKTFYMNSCRQVTTTAPLKGAELASVHISNCLKLADLNGLESMKADKLKAVFYYNLNLTDLTALQGLTFDHLSIKESGHFKSLAFLQGVTVHVLELEAEQVADLSPFKSVKITHTLKLRGDQITDLSPLGRQRCRHLGLYCSSVRSLKALESMPYLQSLYVHEDVPGSEVDRLKRAKPRLKVTVYR